MHRPVAFAGIHASRAFWAAAQSCLGSARVGRTESVSNGCELRVRRDDPAGLLKERDPLPDIKVFNRDVVLREVADALPGREARVEVGGSKPRDRQGLRGARLGEGSRRPAPRPLRQRPAAGREEEAGRRPPGPRLRRRRDHRLAAPPERLAPGRRAHLPDRPRGTAAAGASGASSGSPTCPSTASGTSSGSGHVGLRGEGVCPPPVRSATRKTRRPRARGGRGLPDSGPD